MNGILWIYTKLTSRIGIFAKNFREFEPGEAGAEVDQPK
ncbi:conserved hypothetical protein [Waddlia chondrophila WSU 86-1044]|uniref:Uncharacterized protein n=1 Tax=Waddlia chondrophila (strain ATCC VR-1470 / WSU 86-1044) TaxID=716544 RepID=D6YWP3_WADCW|nr:conserved hypothetical protein [Waddlia chondrophila WSU 86-1044]